MTSPPAVFRKFYDCAVSLVLYGYFTAGFLLLFFYIYLFFHLFSRRREVRFQQTTHWFYRAFLRLATFLMPWIELRIGDDVRAIRSSVVISNHISYLDPILLISLFEKHKTIVKNRIFHYPFFSWVLETSGYLPSDASGKGSPILMKNLDTMQEFLASGGNLFVFPEGRRSRDGMLAPFNKGAFTIARRCGAPIQVLRIRNSDRLLRPGRVPFNATEKMVLSVERLRTIPAQTMERADSLSRIIEEVRSLYDPPSAAAERNEVPS